MIDDSLTVKLFRLLQ